MAGIEVTAQGARTLLPQIIETAAAAGANVSAVEVDRARPGGRLPAPHRQGAAGLGSSTVRAALDIAFKDLRQKVRDRSALLISVVAPFVLAALFAMILGGLDEDFQARWAYVDLDGGAARGSTRRGPAQRAWRPTVSSSSNAWPRPPRRRGRGRGAARSRPPSSCPRASPQPPLAGAGATVRLIVDPDAAISGQVARSVLAGFASSIDAVQLSVATALLSAGGFPDAETTAALAEQARPWPTPSASWMPPPPTARPATPPTTRPPWPSCSSSWRPSSASSASTRSGAAGPWPACWRRPCVVVDHRRQAHRLAGAGRWSRWRVIIVGTALLLGASWGDPFAVVALVLAAALAATGVSLLTVAFTRNEEQAGSAIAIVSLLAGGRRRLVLPGQPGPGAAVAAQPRHAACLVPRRRQRRRHRR